MLFLWLYFIMWNFI